MAFLKLAFDVVLDLKLFNFEELKKKHKFPTSNIYNQKHHKVLTPKISHQVEKLTSVERSRNSTNLYE